LCWCARWHEFAAPTITLAIGDNKADMSPVLQGMLAQGDKVEAADG
jgi:hypothetical protein